MNFYIGNSLPLVNVSEDNVLVSEELVEYIYKQREKSAIDLKTLYGIDPYNNVVISIPEVIEIIEICKYLLHSQILDEYLEKEDALEEIMNLYEISLMALSKNCGLISIGD